MPYITTLLLGLSSGITGYAGVTHLLIGSARRPRDRTQLVFGFLALAITVHILVVLRLHTAPSVAAYVGILKYGFGTTSLVVLSALLWFVAHFTGVQPRRFLLAMTLWWAILYVLHLSLPAGILYREVTSLRPITVFGRDQIVIARGAPHPLRPTIDLWYLVAFAFFFTALTRQYRRHQRRSALVLGLALMVFPVTRVVDTLLNVGRIDSIYTTQFAFLGIVIAMSLLLSHRITATEIALQRYQQQLHVVVAERTAALTDTNSHLAQKIIEHERAAALVQRSMAELTALKQVAHIATRLNDLSAALHGMSETITALFDASVTHMLIPSDQRTDRHLVVGFAQGRGPLGPLPLDVALTNLPLVSRVLREGRSLIAADVQMQALPSAVQALVDPPQLPSVMLIPLVIRGTVIGCMTVATDQADRTFTPHEVSLAETIASDVAAAIDNTRLYQHSVAARERLTLLYQAGQAMSRASLNPEQVYAELHTATTRLMPVDVFSITLIDAARADARDVYLVNRGGRQPERRYPLAESLVAVVLERNQAVRIDDLQACAPPTRPQHGDPDVAQSCVAVLLRGSTEVIGVLVVQRAAQRAHSDEDVDLLELLAAHAAIALENARRYHEAGTVAVSAERHRLSRELHDSVTQTLYAISMVAEALPRLLERDLPAAKRQVVALRQTTLGVLAEMRMLLFELHPPTLASTSVTVLLHQLAAVLHGRTRIPVAVTVTGEIQLSPVHKIGLYRIAQEALNNIAKHGQATEAWVALEAAAEVLLLTIRDNGRGFDPTAVPPECMGVRIMRERAEELGAELVLASVPGQGTQVLVRSIMDGVPDQRPSTNGRIID